METINIMGCPRVLKIIAALLLILFSVESPVESASDRILTVRLKSNISLDDLIEKSGYRIDDADVIPFLTEFARLNEHITTISSLRKDSLVKLPTEYLKKVGSQVKQTRGPIRQPEREPVIKKEKERIVRRVLDREVILRNIKLLSDAIDDSIRIESVGFKVITINERSEISLDASFFPMIAVSNERIVVLDYTGILPEEVKNIIEISWPEYRIVSAHKQDDLKSIIRGLLIAMGYSVSVDKRIVIGGLTKIEYDADLVIYRNDRDLLDSEITVIGIVGDNELSSPEILARWLLEKDINLVELSYEEIKKIHGTRARLVKIDSSLDSREFTESLLSHIGYKYSRNEVLNLSDRKEFTFNLRADISIDMGSRTKVIEFAELSDFEIDYARKKGYDIACIIPDEDRFVILRKIAAIFPFTYNELPEIRASHLTPKRVKYRVISAGVFMNSLNGPLFITRYDADANLLSELIDSKNTILTF